MGLLLQHHHQTRSPGWQLLLALAIGWMGATSLRLSCRYFSTFQHVSGCFSIQPISQGSAAPSGCPQEQQWGNASTWGLQHSVPAHHAAPQGLQLNIILIASSRARTQEAERLHPCPAASQSHGAGQPECSAVPQLCFLSPVHTLAVQQSPLQKAQWELFPSLT